VLKNYLLISVVIGIFVYAITSIAAEMPDGFAVWSEGNSTARTIMMRTLKSDGTMGTPVKVVEKGNKGGDISNQISFDGKWLAFARSLGANSGHGGDDYHDWAKWDVYIARLDGNYPTTAIKVGHGYWPSWGEDSYNAKKTLYFSTQDPKWTISKVTIDENGLVEGSTEVAALPKISGYKGHMMMAPNGKFMACRAVQSVYLEFFEDWMGQKAGSTIEIAGGCHPSICADSRWVIHAGSTVARVGQKGTKLAKSGPYHFGTSQDLGWFVTQIGGGARSQNNAHKIYLHPVKIKGEEGNKHFNDEGSFSSGDFVPYGNGVLLTSGGSSPDVHVNIDHPTPVIKPAGKTLMSAMNAKIELMPHRLIVTKNFSEPTHVSVFDLVGKQIGAFNIEQGLTNTLEFNQKLSNGFYYIRFNSASGQNIVRKMVGR